LEADRAGWLKKLRRTLRFLLPTSGEAIVLDFVQTRLIRRDELAFDIAEGGPGPFVFTKSLDRERPLAESNSPPVHKPAGYFNRMRRGSELGRQIAVDFESDADFHQCGSSPVHSFLPLFHYKPANIKYVTPRRQDGPAATF
jgi:hypothetical protein